MRRLRCPSHISMVLALAATLTATAFGQANLPEEPIGGPLTGAPVLGAPFSADATTTVRATLGDGTRLDQSTTDRYYRDSAGRVRVERWMGLTTGGGRAFEVYVGGVQFVAFRRGDLLAADPGVFGDVREESLGNRRIAGVETTGRRVTIVVPPGYRRNEQWMEMTDERWESPELKLPARESFRKTTRLHRGLPDDAQRQGDVVRTGRVL